MYDREKRCWLPECHDESVLERCRKDQKEGRAEDYFLLADSMLASSQSGKETAEAVWMMEEAAKANYAPAAYAMGQMFRYGWAVHRDLTHAARWFEKAAQLDYDNAKTALAELKRKKKCRIMAFGLALAFLALFSVIAFQTVRQFTQKNSGAGNARLMVLVGEDTELKETVTLEEFNEELRNLIAEYDTELVIGGELNTNRLILKFEGEELDLTEFLADRVITRENNKIIIQFSSEEEARRCLNALQNMEGVVYVEEDVYYKTEAAVTYGSYDSGLPQPPVYTSVYSGYGYYSWGVIDLELDQLAAWIKAEGNNRRVMVAVVDSGVLVNQEFQDRILDGVDLLSGGDGHADGEGHGTHVAGTVLDCTRGLNVEVLPVRVMNNEGKGNIIITAAGVEYAAAEGADVINMSLGGPASAALDDAVREAVGQGIVVVASAGNGDDRGIPMDTVDFSPARVEECIVVSAYAADHNIAGFSNYGNSVDVSAPGVGILSYYEIGLLTLFDGTSMAAPHISALAAMLRICYPDAAPSQLEKYIKDYCVDMGNAQFFGKGICRASGFIEY